jgi:hypothetical protein
MILNPGRKILFWAGVYLTAQFTYVLFDRLYTNWLVWQGVNGAFDFWDVQLGLLPIVAAEVVAVVAAALMVVWNFWARARPAAEVTYLFWIGLAIMAFFGPTLVTGLAYYARGYSAGGYPFEMWLQPLVPVVVGFLMVLTAWGMTIARLNRKPVPAST